MTMLDGFHPVTEVTADDRARIAMGRAGVVRDSRYAVSANDAGDILLTPLASIPARELVVWENDELRASLFRGLAQAAEGKGRELPWLDQIEVDDE